MTDSEPTIPLKHAELLHAALSTAILMLDQIRYPIENMESVIEVYRASRDRYLKASGYSSAEINLYADAATDALVTWFEAKETSKKKVSKDFEQWAKELMDE